ILSMRPLSLTTPVRSLPRKSGQSSASGVDTLMIANAATQDMTSFGRVNRDVMRGTIQEPECFHNRVYFLFLTYFRTFLVAVNAVHRFPSRSATINSCDGSLSGINAVMRPSFAELT